MPNDLFNTPYSVAHQARNPSNPLKRSPVLPPSHGESIKPDFLLSHENKFDANTYTPESAVKAMGAFGGQKPITQI